MFTSKLTRMAGLGSILAGVLWIGLMLVDQLQVASIFDGEPWDYLGLLAVLLFLLAVAALYPGKSGPLLKRAGLVTLAISALVMGLSLLLYMLEVDPEDGAAFSTWLLGTVLLGLGLLLFGIGRSVPSGAAAKALGVLLIIAFPAAYVLLVALAVDLDAAAGLLWGSVMVMQALGWMVIGRHALAEGVGPAEVEPGVTG